MVSPVYPTAPPAGLAAAPVFDTADTADAAPLAARPAVPVAAASKGRLVETVIRNLPPTNPNSIPFGSLDIGFDQLVYGVAETHQKTSSWLRLPNGRQVAGFKALQAMLPSGARGGAGAAAEDDDAPNKKRFKYELTLVPEPV